MRIPYQTANQYKDLMPVLHRPVESTARSGHLDATQVLIEKYRDVKEMDLKDNKWEVNSPS